MAKKHNAAVVLDSCVWIAFLCDVDSQHSKAGKLVKTLCSEILVPEYVLIEVATVLRQKKYNAEACAFVEKVVNDPAVFLPAQNSVYGAARLFCTDKRSALSFVDTVLFELSTAYEVVTFDNALAKAMLKKAKK